MKIFISYATKTRALISTLIEDLETLGHTVWFDQELSGGEAWWDKILESMRNCDLFVFSLTPESLDSYPCQLEFTYAAQLNKHILPVVLAPINDALKWPDLGKIHHIDYRQRDTKTALLLSRALNQLPATAALPEVMPPSPPVPLHPLTKLKERLSVAAMSGDEQITVLMALKSYATRPEAADAALNLLKQLWDRQDLLASVDREIRSFIASTDPDATSPTSMEGVKSGVYPSDETVKNPIVTVTAVLKAMSRMRAVGITPMGEVGVIELEMYKSGTDEIHYSVNARLTPHVALGEYTATNLYLEDWFPAGEQFVRTWDSFQVDSPESEKSATRIAKDLIKANGLFGIELSTLNVTVKSKTFS